MARFIPQPGTNFTVGQEPQITSALGKLAAYLNKNIYGISGYRSPAHSVAVGGFANDPHTKGQAADIGVGSPSRASAGSLTAAVLARFGLYRPFDPTGDPNNPEVNHVQLLRAGTPVTGNRVGAASPSVGNIPSYVPPKYIPWVRGAAQGTGLPASIVAAQIKDESNFDPNAKSSAGAVGIAQFLPSTFKGYGKGSPYNASDAQGAYINYMNTLLKQYKGNIRNALAAYNAGPGNLAAGYGYADKILSAAGIPQSATAGSASSYGGTRPGGQPVGSGGGTVDDIFKAYNKELTTPRTAPQGFTPIAQAGWTAPFQWWWQSFSGNYQAEQGNG